MALGQIPVGRWTLRPTLGGAAGGGQVCHVTTFMDGDADPAGDAREAGAVASLVTPERPGTRLADATPLPPPHPPTTTTTTAFISVHPFQYAAKAGFQCHGVTPRRPTRKPLPDPAPAAFDTLLDARAPCSAT
jgi:hypothetical protein